MSIITKSLRQRFAKLIGQPMFELALEAYAVASDRDDEWGMRRIVDQLAEQYMLAGFADPGGECWDCGERKLELQYEEQCNACVELEEAEQAERERQRKEREAAFAALPPEEQERRRAEATRTMRIFLGGLIARDVQ